MRILALETSGMAGSVAALEDDLLLSEIELDPLRRTAQTLVPALHDILRQVGWQPQDVNLVAVTSGPGSFTGLRIGVTTAKTFAYATGAAVLGVNTLAVVARGVTAAKSPVTDGPLWVVMNAERHQLYAASFRRHEWNWTEVEATRIVDNQVWLTRLTTGAIVTGMGLQGVIAQVPAGVHIVSESQWMPRASDVGREGLQAFRAGRAVDCWSLLPNYYRESAAVEKAAILKSSAGQ